MTQQATQIEPKVKMSKLTLSRETLSQLADSQRGEARNPTHGTGCCFTHNVVTFCLRC